MYNVVVVGGLTYGPWSGAQVADAALGEPHDDLSPFAP